MHRIATELSALKRKITQATQASKNLVQLTVMKQVTVEEQNLKFVFNYCADLNKKRRGFGQTTSNPFLPPFSDLYIGEISPTHRLLLNKYCVSPNHVLVVTRNFEHQGTPLNRADFAASIQVMRSINGILFFNSGPIAGASQPHKHLQILPIEAFSNTSILDAIEKHAAKNAKLKKTFFEFDKFKFEHIICCLPELDARNSDSIEAYAVEVEGLYKQCLAKLDNTSLEKNYNFLMVDNWLMLVSRRKEAAMNNQISINSLGFLGNTISLFLASNFFLASL
jgi:ATP adenylyltransferase